ncbi:4-amino-4-deoxy-L-arabinose transferase-like glycosyltransferase [Pseudomonas psychrotolerans]|nr:4-amino-4-deoxy-L-arabinose transferase-like glycosyltransferase [Pseudomonas psychrotolerans]
MTTLPLSIAKTSTTATRAKLGAESLLVFVAALAFFTLGIWDQAPQGFDYRWAVFLNEMFRHGPAFFPTTYGQPYPDYPGTATWLSWLAARVIGAPNQLANVLPTALAAAGVLGLTYRILADRSRAWALLTILLVALTPQWLEKARAVCLDQLVALVVLGCFYLLYSADRDQRPGRRLLVLPLFALGFAIRGPLGLIESLRHRQRLLAGDRLVRSATPASRATQPDRLWPGRPRHPGPVLVDADAAGAPGGR